MPGPLGPVVKMIGKNMYFEEEVYERQDFSAAPIKKGEYENCTFQNCNFSDSDISGIRFTECEFQGCNLSMVKLNGTAFNGVRFMDTKMFGLQFENCDDLLLAVGFVNCTLNHSSFFGVDLRNTVFNSTKLHEVDFTKSDLSKSVFKDCDFTRAVFAQTNIEGSDFTTSYNYIIDPEINRVRKAKFDLQGVVGLLAKYDIEIS